MPTKNKKQNLVPELRFPEFRGDWCLEPMGRLYSFIPTNSFSRDTMNEGSGEVRNIHYGDIHTKLPALLDLESTDLPCLNASISLTKFKDHNFCKSGDVIFADASEDIDDVGKSLEVVNTNGLQVLSGLHTIHARQKKARFIAGFAGHLFHSDGIRIQIQRESQGAKVLGISGTRLSAVEVYFPEDQTEQQKIADCLGSLDELLAAHRSKLAALQDHKKGLLQQLFPAEGETTPNLRFPGFEGEWEVKRISELGKVVTGSTPSTKRSDFFKGSKLFVSPADISETRFVERTNTTLTDLGFAQTRKIAKHSILFVCIGSTIGKIAQNSEECATNQQINSLVPHSNYDNGFVYFCLSRHAGTIAQMAANQAVPIINKTLFSSFEILVPSPPEQQKIADCLSALDALITAQTEQIAALQAHKKGLMQQLFPNPEGGA